jgi:hypothetical protein
MCGVSKPNARGGVDPAKGDSSSRRILLFIAPDETISESLVHAVEREFPWIGVERLRNMSAAWTAFEHPASLILIDMAFLHELGIPAVCSSRAATARRISPGGSAWLTKVTMQF